MKKALKSKALMIQGTASSVGKSILCTALCRIFSQDGYNVNPFKSQNMSLNSYITPEGHEMGRAQVMQAEAAGKIPNVKMNPILLKPTSDRKSQVIINGKVYANMDAVEYFAFKPQLKTDIKKTYDELETESDLVIIEGAGSPAEINLKKNDFVNMGMAKLAKSPVILVGDIDRGGVFASLAGTMLLLDEDERKLVKGVIINKFRGSLEILEPGLKMLEEIIKIPVLGVVPFFKLNIEDEDSASYWMNKKSDAKDSIDIAVIRLPYMSNFTDFNSLLQYSDVGVRFVELGETLGQPDIIILPGTKSTISDMKNLRDSTMAEKIIKCHQNGSYVFGICGGFQMLGQRIYDPMKVETSFDEIEGLGLINTETQFMSEKTTVLSEGIDRIFKCHVRGYEIHMGETSFLGNVSPFIDINTTEASKNILDGAVNDDLTVFGTYLHGIFDSASFTRSFLNMVRRKKGLEERPYEEQNYWVFKESQYDQLADIVRQSLDMDKIYSILSEEIVEVSCDA